MQVVSKTELRNIQTMSKQEYMTSLQQDPYNVRGGRTRRNTPLTAYNCGGFALSVYDWVTPYITTENHFKNDEGLYTDDEREEIMKSCYNDGWDLDEIEKEILLRDTDFLLGNYDFLEQVNPEDCSPDDTLIAYRIFIEWDEELGEVVDDDFHFKVRYHGFWFEKMGSEEITVCNLDDNKDWVYPTATYTSPIVYFTTRRKKL